MRVGMHEMHALRVRGFFHDNDRGGLCALFDVLTPGNKGFKNN